METQESIVLMEPMLPESGNRQLEDLSVDLVSKSVGLAKLINPQVQRSLGNLVRSMNCYYSNLIEGHYTHPRDIDRALENKLSSDSKKRNLQLEAKAHIEVQALIDTPFLDGNGRVARLFSHAFLRHIGLGSSLWSVSRGLARRVGDYKKALSAADESRSGDLDGRGSLSAKGLENFCRYFLETCIDQVEFMAEILEPSELLRRIQLYTTDEVAAGRLPKGSFPILREALLAGQIERGQAAALTGYKERQARTVLAELIKRSLLVSDSAKGAVRLGFPLDAVERWLPKLYPEG